MIIIYLYMITMFIRPQDWVPGMTGLSTALILIPIGLMLGFNNYIKNPDIYKTPINKIIPVYLLVILLSTFINTDSSYASEQTIEWLKRSMLFYMVILNVDTFDKLKKTMNFLLLICLFLGYQAILQGYTGESWGGLTPYPGYTEIRVRWFGDWDGPNVFGILFLIASAISLEYVSGRHSHLFKLFNILCLMIFIAAIFYTNSRGTVLAFLCGVLFYYRDYIKLKYMPVFATIMGAFIVYWAPSRMTEINSKESSAHERTWMWEQGLGMFRENPIFGIGRGQFAERVDLKMLAHNNYVQNFTELGIIGFALFMSIVWFCFKGTYIVSTNSKMTNTTGVYGRMMTAMLIMYLAATYFVVMELDILYFIFGISTATYLIARQEDATLQNFSYTKFDIFMISGIAVGIIISVWLAAVAQIL